MKTTTQLAAGNIHFAGLDVSVKETSICIVDDAGKIVREVKVADARRSATVGGRLAANGGGLGRSPSGSSSRTSPPNSSAAAADSAQGRQEKGLTAGLDASVHDDALPGGHVINGD